MSLDDANTKALLHFTGADASTIFTDESGKVWTRAGSAQIDTAQYKFQPSSMLLDGTNDYISTPNHTDLSPGSGDFTVDFWMRYSGASGVQKALCSKGIDGTLGQASWEMLVDDSGIWWYSTASGDWSAFFPALAPGNANNGAWHHVAAVSHGTNFILFLDGIGSYTPSGPTSVFTISQPMYIGASFVNNTNPAAFSGWIDEFRFSRIARWTSDFTPPTGPYGAFIPRIMMIGGQ